MGAAVYGARWTKPYGELPIDSEGALTIAGRLWARELGGHDRDTILAALEQHIATGDEWPPNLPQMRKACAGIPSLARVRVELTQRNAKRSAFAAQVWTYLDAHRYRLADAEQADRMLAAAYDLAVEHVMRGGTLPDVAGELAAPAPEKHTTAPPETARRHLSEIATRLRLEDDGVDDEMVSEMRLETP